MSEFSSFCESLIKYDNISYLPNEVEGYQKEYSYDKKHIIYARGALPMDFLQCIVFFEHDTGKITKTVTHDD